MNSNKHSDMTGWRYRCPNGHVDVRRRQTDESGAEYYCNTCRDKRAGEWQDPHHDHLIDAKTGERV